MSDTVTITRDVPVVDDVDVLIAGGGIAGCVAAVTAARNGAGVAVVERFGAMGGNMGPGMFSGGAMHLALGFPHAFPGRLEGIPGEFIDRCEGYCDGKLGHHYAKDSQVVSYTWLRLMQENRVRLILNSWVSGAILDGRRIVGLTVENKSGTQAIRAKVVIDATGDADVAARAGAVMDEGDSYSYPGMYFDVAGVDAEAYLAYRNRPYEPSEEDLAWATEAMAGAGTAWFISGLNWLLPLYRDAWEMGAYFIAKPVGDLAGVTMDHGLYGPKPGGTVGAQLGFHAKQPLHSGDASMAAELEFAGRIYIFETAQFLRRSVPGFQNSYLQAISPYFHFRGGRSAVTRWVMKADDVRDGTRHDDVIYLHYGSETNERAPGGNDFPYRQLLPEGVEGLLMAGRSGIIQRPCMRDRWKIMLMAQAAGLAAAMAAADDVIPADVDIRRLQRTLHETYRVGLGDAERRKELGLA